MSAFWQMLAAIAVVIAWIGLSLALAVLVCRRLRDRQPPEDV